MKRRTLLLTSLGLLLARGAFAADPLNILVTNDDGYAAPGIRALRKALTAAGHNVTVVAPRTDQSGKSMSIFTDSAGRLNVRYETAENAYSVAGTPVDCVQAALQVVLKQKPDLIVSGINFGENLGTIANSSGTVGAAVSGLTSGIPSIAVSAGLNFAEAGMSPPFPSTFVAMDRAAERVVQLISVLQANRAAGQPLLPVWTGLNMNYPAVPNPGSPLMTTLSRTYNTLKLGLKPAPDYATTGDLMLAAAPVPPPAIPDRLNDAEMFAVGYITITPIDGDWTASMPQFQEVRQRLLGFVE